MEQCDVDQNDSNSGDSSATISEKSICGFSSSMGISVCSSSSSSSTNGSISGSSTSSSLLSNGEESDNINSSNNNNSAINININQDDQYCTETRNWTERVPIGLRFCPWAIKAKRQNRIKYISCLATDPFDKFWKQQNHGEPKYGHHDVLQVPSNDYDYDNSRDDEINNERKDELMQLFFQQLQNQITLVSFHPKFSRWRGLPYNIKVGSIVQCHQGMSGFTKSQEIYLAKILETSNSIFGQRRIKVQFLEDGREQQQQTNNDNSSNNAADRKKTTISNVKKEQYVPVDWIVFDDDNTTADSSPPPTTTVRPPLLDNCMHQTPYPTIHLIQNNDLGTLCVRDISRLKRKNIKTIMKLAENGTNQLLS
ncbi:hypothetical protein FRACYDRAFT_249690 [Fragilariopsis cylindrus CCMP1102]|uniref:Uncharacterized protein n=1 Tax=Fragilariopsis cylindrus CCMP1102 TaxID=635003 RepID=A0A1E7ERG1_9STRA|nr:hypothetical protein FRACYDRAFT_249690 [Fragilariopsis cylindrus CCMP1102]|eukprot:OEU08419.1 hypothetical protein FRACYDRAFT_249690 [Fragilariopsis cylindrus CCMP1102]